MWDPLPLLSLIVTAGLLSEAVLVPPSKNLALGRSINATATCGEANGQPIQDLYCTIAGAQPYSPHNPYSYSLVNNSRKLQEMKFEHSFLQNGQNCDHCKANSPQEHPAYFMVDGSPSWWMSPPLSRGMQYHEVNITIDLGQEFHIAYVWVQMANSPRPAAWVLERSDDFGQTFKPWQYFASNAKDCARLFHVPAYLVNNAISEDDEVICTTDFSGIHPMENGEMVINLLEGRPGKNAFGLTKRLQEFVKATNVRLRFLRANTMYAQLMDYKVPNDPTVTRRYYYAVKEIYMGGRCICNGHASSCNEVDPSRKTLVCQCEHNTCGDNCDRCCKGFEQKKWKPSGEQDFVCEPCNCHGHSDECVFDEALEKQNLSLDIHGRYQGGGKCLNCRDNTVGINCNQCADGFYRPVGKYWNETDVCQRCQCDPGKHLNKCAEETGVCECLPQFAGPNCDQCAEGYYHPPECRPCECNVNGTSDGACLPEPEGKCNCKDNFYGDHCELCAPGYTNVTASCVDCHCDASGSQNNECDVVTGECNCASNFAGKTCSSCAKGYYDHPQCKFCDCDPSGTEEDICDKTSGQCLCKPGFVGRRCDKCDANYFGYPNCQECKCDETGALSPACSESSGQCQCKPNFTGPKCDRCAIGFYKYPDCFDCQCNTLTSKSKACDSDGKCYCKENIEGQKCDRCKPKLFNYPRCEECNCNPNGVIDGFAGCDTVREGELCTCKENVDGRTCAECKPTFWDLSLRNPEGCVDCNCNMTGVISFLNTCDLKSGQCHCKAFVAGQKCDSCADGYYNIDGALSNGCQPCDCDAGGSLGHSCNPHTGQCRCRPRIEGIRCDKPIKDHFFPSLWQMKYEAESGHQANGKPVRYAIDKTEFPDYSYRGYAVFSPVQDEIFLDIDVRKVSVYKLLVHYRNAIDVFIPINFKFVPIQTQTSDSNFTASINLPSGNESTTIMVENKEKPFLLNPGRWKLGISTPKRLFLDYVVLIPAEYYSAVVLKSPVSQPCPAIEDPDTPCVDYLYPPLKHSTRVESNAKDALRTFDQDGAIRPLNKLSVDVLPAIVGQAAHVPERDFTRNVEVDLEVPADGDYYLVVEYFNPSNASAALRTRVEQNNASPLSEAVVYIGQCPFNTFCRELVSHDGQPGKITLKKSPPKAMAVFSIPPGMEFALASVNLISADNWDNKYLKQHPVCIRRDYECVGINYPIPPNSIKTPVVKDTVSGDKLPFKVHDGQSIKVVPLDNNATSTVDISGVVDKPGHYVFVIHYFNPENDNIPVDVLFQTEVFGTADFKYCPSTAGCRVEIFQKRQVPPQNYFPVTDKYSWTFYANSHQRAPIYLESITAVPVQDFKKELLSRQPLDQTSNFFKHCSDKFFENHPSNVSDYCKQQVFSLTSEFNHGALPCDCNPKGSVDFCCEEYGGNCKCKENIIGRTCDRCAPGFHSYPECKPCKCGDHQMCDEQTGQCYCPNYVEGQTCDRCVPYAFGYDVLIGCQLCGCNEYGSMNGELQCDAKNGQCLCKEGVGGRRCEKCLAGYYAFPHCQKCSCDVGGTVPDVCDANTAECKCKKNVEGPRCDTCVAGTFHLQPNHPNGCSECFCFGVTDQCTSSSYPVYTIRFDEGQWTSNDTSGTVKNVNNQIIYEVGTESSSRNVYLEAPLKKSDFTSSYGLHMSFKIASTPQDPSNRKATSEADVRLVSGNTILELWAQEQPKDPSLSFEVVVTFSPDFWLLSTGEPANRQTLMMVMYNLEKIQLKASYYEYPSSAVLEDFVIEEAVNRRPDSYDLKAPYVEVCSCPTGYSGFSCQECASGFYRIKSDSDQFLGACVPCNCNGHSGTCDSATGICSDCQHNTYGDHCEFCEEGFYGNATTGSYHSCLPCPCPRAQPGGNFAKGCVISEGGYLDRCDCKEGYTGRSCEQCAVGFFGQPSIMKPCQRCYCNENNDLSAPDSCNPENGECGNCLHNTDGPYCDYCQEWFFGGALAKTCQNCTCDQCGSKECDNKSGQCQCKDLVEGKNCDKCAENTWGFNSCEGCKHCECAAASSNSQCDLISGKCSCMPGADGQHCDTCQNGYWDYSPQGCKKCDCEADLSMGTVCNIKTGQCQCQEGATGPRCDNCLPGFLRIPEHGCRRCDECATALNTELDDFDLSVNALTHTLSNISNVAITGARLARIEKSVNSYNPAIDFVTELSEGAGLKSLTSQLHTQKTSVDAFAVKVNRFNDTLNANLGKITSLLDDLKSARQDANDLGGVARLELRKVEELANEFDSAVPVENSEDLIKEAENLISKIREIHQNITVHNINEIKSQIENEPELVRETREKKEQRQKTVLNLQAKLSGVSNTTSLYHNQINGVKKEVVDAQKIIEDLVPRLRSVSIAFEGVEKEINKKQDIQDKIIKINSEVKKTLEAFTEEVNALTALQNDLKDKKEQIAPRTEESARIRRDAYNDQYNQAKQKADELVEQERKLADLYNKNIKSVSKNIEAATAYTKIASSIKTAQKDTEEALNKAKSTKDVVKNLSENVDKKLTENKGLNKNVGEVSLKLQENKKKIEVGNSNLEEQHRMINKLKQSVAKAQPPASISNDLKVVSGNITLVNDILDKHKTNIEGLSQRQIETIQKADDIAAVFTNLTEASDSTKATLKSINEFLPTTLGNTKEAKERLDKALKTVDDIKSKLSSLKEKAGLIREKANQVKLAVHLDQGSFLELPIPQSASELSTVTDTRTFFRTRRDSGLIYYLGNEATSKYTDFIAVEIDQQRPRLVGSFGREVFELQLDELVSDNLWRQIVVERVGKQVDFSLSKPNSYQISTNKSLTISGQKNVLNLYDNSRHLFIGSSSSNVKLPVQLKTKNFDGDIDSFKLNGESLGFWNSEKAERVVGAETSAVSDGDTNEAGISFNGKGYSKISIGTWNPRKRTSLLLSFNTHSPDGLLFFIGKSGDQLSIRLEAGQVILSFDLGSGLVRLASNKNNYNDGKWHLVQITRKDREAKLVVDNEDVTEGESPGTMFEMSVSDSLFLGGLPDTEKASVTPFKGCLRNLKLDTEYVNLRSAKSSKGVQNSCPNKDIKLVTLVSERSFLKLQGVHLEQKFDLAIRFRTSVNNGHIISVLVNDESLIGFTIEEELLMITVNGEKVPTKLNFIQPFENRWHYIYIRYAESKLSVLLDDNSASEFHADFDDLLPSDASIVIGKQNDEQAILGCVADLLVNNKLISFVNNEANEIQFTGCLQDESVHSEKAPTTETPTDEADDAEITTTPSTEVKPKKEKSNPRAPGSCALPLEPQGEREDIRGVRFGYNAGSRIEYNQVSESLKQNVLISLQIRANSANGVILFATNDKHTDHIALYLLEGKVCLSFGAVDARLIIQGRDSILDDEWHDIRAEKEGPSAILFVDNEQVDTDRVVNADLINVEAPLYVGGLPNNLHSFIARLLPGVKSEFGGCLRDLKINDEDLTEENGEGHGVVPCSQLSEEGIFFGKDGGYAMVSKFVSNKQFQFELEIKPRVKTAVILSVGVIDCVTIQLVNGTVKLAVDDGAGASTVIYTPPHGSTICDGNWHKIKAIRKKSIVTLNVDGKSNLIVIKNKTPTGSTINDPLYFGGVPKERRVKALETNDSYVGCMRILTAQAETKRRRRNLDSASMVLFGNLDRNSCPLN